MPDPNHADCYRFGHFELQPAERRLLASTQPAPLNARAFDLLLVLVERAGQLVSKDELLQRVWPKLVVEEGNLQVQVSTLRKVLGAHAIETVPGHGYRLTLEVSTGAAASTAPPAVRRNNLPPQLTSFIGRTDDIAEQTRLLDGTRLLTITGVGGLGKTRLALQLAAAVQDRFADGVFLIEFAPLSDPRLVDTAVAAVLGVRGESGGLLRDAVLHFVKDRKLLLILDNCEHVLAAAAELVRQLLQAGPYCKLIASSREPLHVAGEVTYPLAPLAVPNPLRPLSLEDLTRYSATCLFIDRAAAAQPGFQATVQNMTAVAEITRRLDGIPLALELAAARMRLLSVETIARRLDDRFHLLKRGDQTMLPRQQTLRATMDWSYELLAPGERALFGRLAVHVGGFTLEGAEVVGAGGDIADVQLLDLLGNLVEKSLVTLDVPGGRYRMLETVRQYALERLVEAGEEEVARQRHLAFYLALAEKAASQLVGSEEGPWYSRLEAERENLLSAHAWCNHAVGGAEAGLRLVFAVRRWLCRGSLELGFPLAAEALARSGAPERGLPRCGGLFAAAFLCYYMGRYADAQRYGEESLSIARTTGAMVRVADALGLLGVVCLGQDDRPAARRHLVEGLAIAREAGDHCVLLDAVNGLAELESTEGNLETAALHYEEALALARDLGSRDYTGVLVLNLARVSVGRVSTAHARELLLAALTLFEETGSTRDAHGLLAIAAGLAASVGAWERAARFCGASEAQLAQRGLRREPADEKFLAPLIAATQQALGSSEFDAAMLEGRTLDVQVMLIEARTWLQDIPQHH